jgi:hypothetical protein
LLLNLSQQEITACKHALMEQEGGSPPRGKDSSEVVNLPSNLRAVGSSASDGSSEKEFGGSYTTTPSSFKSDVISFQRRVARMNASSDESHLHGELREVRDLIDRLLGGGNDEDESDEDDEETAMTYRHLGAITQFRPTRR